MSDKRDELLSAVNKVGLSEAVRRIKSVVDNDAPDPCPKCGARVADGMCGAGLFTEVITNAVINAIGDTEGEPIGLRAATILTAISKTFVP